MLRRLFQRQSKKSDSPIRRSGILAMGLSAIVVVDALVVWDIVRERRHLINTAVETLDGESSMYESFARRSIAGVDETLLFLGDRAAAGAAPWTIAALADNLVARSPLIDRLTVTVNGEAVADGGRPATATASIPPPGCVPREAGLVLGPLPPQANDGDIYLVVCRTMPGGSASAGAVLPAARLQRQLQDLKENWATSIAITMPDGRPVVSLFAKTQYTENQSQQPQGRLIIGSGERWSVRSALVRDEGGHVWLSSEHAVTGYALLVTVSMPLDEILRQWTTRAMIGGILAVCVTAGLAGLMALLSRQASYSETTMRQLAQSEAETRAILDQTFQIVVILGLDGRIRRVNETAIRTFGVIAAETIGHFVWDTNWGKMVVSRSLAEERLRAAIGAAVNGGVIRYESRIDLGEPQGIIHLDVVVKPVRDATGAVVEVLLEARDITEANHTRDTLVRSERLAALGGLVAGIAHEVNTPVGVATTSASYLLREVHDLRQRVANRSLTTSKMQEFLDSAEEAAQLTLSNCDRAAQIIHSFKQVAVDQISGEHRRFDLATYIDEVLTSLRPRLKREPHKIEVDCPAGLIVDTDPGALSQGLTNLIINALIHAFDPGQTGRITISARQDNDDMITLTFADDGRGIPTHLQEQVFDPFFTTKRGAGGSGLGLHILHTAVTVAMRGRLRLVSEPGQGTTFIMTFPQVLPAVTN